MNPNNSITMFKSLFLMSALVVLSFFSKAQTLAEATQKTLSERFESAEADLNALIAKEPTIGVNYAAAGYNNFYWGVSDQDDAIELSEKMDAAEKLFRKGMEVAPTNPLCFVGQTCKATGSLENGRGMPYGQ
jgi:outer membrane scaffolding protein for murein synthesis (MipA/OmpV family)